MNENPPNGQSGDSGTATGSNHSPSKALLNILFGWPFIGSLFLASCAGLWAFIGTSPYALYLIGVGFCCSVFLAAHKISGGWLFRYGLPALLSVLVFLPLHLCVRQLDGSKEHDVDKLSKPQTVSELFVSDFSNFLTHQNTAAWGNGKLTNLVLKLVWDFGARSEFAAVLVPHSDKSYGACLALAGSMTDLLAGLRSGIVATESNPGEPVSESSTNLVFSGRVYLYLDDVLDLEQLADVKRAFEAKNLAVQFRDPRYAAVLVCS